MAGSTITAPAGPQPHKELQPLRVEHNKIIDDLETLRARLVNAASLSDYPVMRQLAGTATKLVIGPFTIRDATGAKVVEAGAAVTDAALALTPTACTKATVPANKYGAFAVFCKTDNPLAVEADFFANAVGITASGTTKTYTGGYASVAAALAAARAITAPVTATTGTLVGYIVVGGHTTTGWVLGTTGWEAAGYTSKFYSPRTITAAAALTAAKVNRG